jgi:hypothetical protein
MVLINKLQMIKIEVSLTLTNQITFILRNANCNTRVSSPKVAEMQPRVSFEALYVKKKKERITGEIGIKIGVKDSLLPLNLPAIKSPSSLLILNY